MRREETETIGDLSMKPFHFTHQRTAGEPRGNPTLFQTPTVTRDLKMHDRNPVEPRCTRLPVTCTPRPAQRRRYDVEEGRTSEEGKRHIFF